MNSKKAWLDQLYYHIGKQQFNYYVCGTFKQKDGEIGFSKWKKYLDAVGIIDFDGICKEDWKVQKFFEQIDQRQILPIEIVLDIEEKKQIKPIVKKLEKWEWEYSIWSTKSRGYHIHIFCDKELEEKEKLAIVKKLGTDIQKCSEKCLIALENEEHWKGRGIKTEINKEEILNGK